ncbi:class I adenylate-forming enzyme family protein [Patulibacter sp.]|uniref:class I adenylate-forming enzyme family protein n=1 Tax=Patulibacter sp. TaxID=1912859 RepID=UPI002722F518|nr:AMP-binding protein [Patulibacter sp.]MDO9407811.1 AMP-binding protein [Patulibacter sp.]
MSAPTLTREVPTLPALLHRAGTTNPDEPAILFEDGLVVTRGDLLERSERFAGWLTTVTEPGEMVAAMTGNRTEFLVAWFAAAATGRVFVALNPEAGPHDLTHVLTDSAAVLVITDPESAGALEAIRDALPALREHLVLDGAEPGGLDPWQGAEPLSFRDLDVDPTTVTNVYYTSGSTGPPKGCMVDHRYWSRLVRNYLTERGLEPTDRVLCCLKFFYNDPSWLLLSSLHAGVPLVVMRRFSVSRFWDVVRDNDVTQLFTIGSIPALLLSAAPTPRDRDHKVRFAVQVAIDAGLHREMTDRWGIPWTDTYGLTETGGLVSVPIAEADRVVGTGTMGKPRADMDVRVVGDDGKPVPTGEVGELVARGDGMMAGYLNRPDATAEAMGDDGFFRTGDRVRQDDDGWFYFVGRKKDIVRRAGENVSATEVEEVLRTHPRVIDAGVVPVADQMRGEEILGHVYVQADEPGLRESIVEHCVAQLAKHKVPRYLVVWTEDLPRTPSMRVAKQRLPRGEVPAGAYDREAR